MSITSQEQETAETQPEDLYEYLTRLIQQATRAYLAEEHIDFDVEQLPIDLRFSAQASFGDYSLPVMPWAGKNKLGRPPLAIAGPLAALLNDMHTPSIEEATPKKPGYVNFRLSHPQEGKDIIDRVVGAG